MNRYIRSAVAALLVVVIFVASYVPIVAVGQPSSYSTSSNSGERDVVCTTLNGTNALDYYTGNYAYDILSEKSSSTILSSLRSLMKSTHSYYSSYNDCKNYASVTDCENNNGKVSLIYTSYLATMSQWNGWNREHVWPKSLGGDNTTGGGADLHHIRPSDQVVNSTRGNKKYGEVNGGTAVYGKNPATGCLGGYSATYFEPLDNVKGDVARICLYVYVRWGSDWGADSITEVFQSVDVLLAWCEMDPVDTWEMGRNEVVEKIQGNRNVFIDYPEYAWLLFGKEVPSDMQTPSGEASEGSSSTPHTHSFVNGKCSCGATDPNYVPPHTHSYVNGKCSCGATDPNYVPPHTHSYVNGQCSCGATDPNYGPNDPHTHSYVNGQCSCGATDPNYVPPHTHSFVNGKCSCGATDPNYVPPCTHTKTEIKNATEAICFKDGYTGDTYCSDCGTKLSSGSAIEAIGSHNFGDYVITSSGEYERHCLTCGAFEILTIDVLFATVETDAEKILLLLIMGGGNSIVLGELSRQ